MYFELSNGNHVLFRLCDGYFFFIFTLFTTNVPLHSIYFAVARLLKYGNADRENWSFILLN